MRVTFSGGPHDGETHEVAHVAPKVLFPGNVEDRQAKQFEDETWGWVYPTDVYVPVSGSNFERFTYSRTVPAGETASS